MNTVIKRFIANGRQIVLRRNLGGRKPTAIAYEVQKQIISYAQLKKQAHLPLTARVLEINQEHGIRISPKVLLRIYKENGIRPLQPKVVFALSTDRQ